MTSSTSPTDEPEARGLGALDDEVDVEAAVEHRRSAARAGRFATAFSIAIAAFSI